jgi:hypothetical protein
MCKKCGCNTCDTKKPALMLNENLAPRGILSEGLSYHLNANKPLTEHLYRAGSTKYFDLWAEARSYYSRGIIDITNEDDLSVLTETNLGHFGMFEGKKVPLDFPMELNEGDYDPDQEQEDDEDEIFMPYDDEGRPLGEATYEEGGEDDRKYALLKVRPENYNLMIDKLQDMNINHTRHSGTEGVIKIYTDRIPDKVLYRLTHDVWVDKFVLKEAKNDNKPIGKPMRDTSGGKAYKVYVKDPKTGNIKTVRFGSGGLRAKINDKKARQAFAARHKCSTRNDKTKASYWSCRLPRYASLLGLKSSFNGFW